MFISPISVSVINTQNSYNIKNKSKAFTNTRDFNIAGVSNIYYPVCFKSKSGLKPLSEEEKTRLFDEISRISKDESLVKKGSLGRVYKVNIPDRPSLAVKEFVNVYETRNPQVEANTLKKLPEKCNRVQKFVDLVTNNDKQYLVTTFQEGESLSKLKDAMSDKLMFNVLDELFKIEAAGISFYDYSMGNIVFQNDEPKFFDFEIANEQSFVKKNNDAFGDLCHLSRNIEFPLITNLAGFEIRTIGKIIGEHEKYLNGEERSNKFVERYLKQASVFYSKTADLFREQLSKPKSEMTEEAVEYSETLSYLFKNPTKEIISIEKQSMRIKELLTEYWFRNDPDLKHDDELYSDGPRYVENLKQRFAQVQKEISNLSNSTKDIRVLEYCKNTSKLLRMISDKEVTYLTKKLCR